MHAVAAALERARNSGLLPAGSSILLAVSGGADSMALLYAAAESAPKSNWRVSVGHVHHGWRRRCADRDLVFVAEHARRAGFPFFSRRCDSRAMTRSLKLSPEAGARQARYAALAEMGRQAGASRIATAHQKDDRLESFLIALCRGAGLATAAGPKQLREDGVVRPLLGVRRSEILEYLKQRGIVFRRDATNGDLKLLRNRIRRALSRLGQMRPEMLEALSSHLDRLDAERQRIEAEFEAEVRPHLSISPGSVLADAEFLAHCPTALARRALEEAARPFAHPGRAALTGREREQILARLSGGEDFRFEAGRHIRFERRGNLLTIGKREMGNGKR